MAEREEVIAGCLNSSIESSSKSRKWKMEGSCSSDKGETPIYSIILLLPRSLVFRKIRCAAGAAPGLSSTGRGNCEASCAAQPPKRAKSRPCDFRIRLRFCRSGPAAVIAPTFARPNCGRSCLFAGHEQSARPLHQSQHTIRETIEFQSTVRLKPSLSSAPYSV